MTKKVAVIGARGYPACFAGSSGIDAIMQELLPLLTTNFTITLYTRSWAKPAEELPTKAKIVAVPCLRHKYLDTGIYSLLATPIALLKGTDIFWYHAPGSCLLAPLPRLVGKKVIVTMHAVEWQREKWRQPLNKLVIKLLEKIAMYSATQCTAVSQDLVNYVSEQYSKTCHLTLPGFTPQLSYQANMITQKYQLQPNQYLLYLGRLVEEKRVDWLIKAFQQSKDISRKYHLVIAGSLDKSNCVKQLKHLAQNNPKILFTDYVSGQLKKELIANCRLFVLPSSLEGNSIALQEALEYNKKCLVADLPLHTELEKSCSLVKTFQSNSFQNFTAELNKNLSSHSPLKANLPTNSWAKTAKVLATIFDA